jgi:4-hydroxybenzoate polyprenyltransferase
MRWWIYQKERFPVFQHGILVLAFSCSAVTYSGLATGTAGSLSSYVVAFLTSFLFFLQLRIADEFKDAEEDAKYRPYRPGPRGLIRLKELAWVFGIAALLQALLAILVSPLLFIPLAITWFYLTLMSKEFFVREWLLKRPITYLWTHMLIMPLIDFYATACHWIPAGEKPWLGLFLFVGASFFNGIVIEIGRKLRTPDLEEEGVPTYSKLWGLERAVWVWIAAMFSTAVFALAAAYLIDSLLLTAISLSLILILAILHGARKQFHNAKRFELLSALWTLTLYLNLGILPAIGLKL